MHTLHKPRFSGLQVLVLTILVSTAQNLFVGRGLPNPVNSAAEVSALLRSEVATKGTSSSCGNFHVQIPSRSRTSHEPLSLPPSVDSVVTYVDAAHGVPALMAYRARCADVDWNANHKDLLFTQAGYHQLRGVDVALDIGACYGDTAVPIAINSQQVIAFEPNPFSFDILELNARLNPHLHILPHNFAVGMNDGDTLKFTYGGDMCNGGIEGVWKDSSQETPIEVETVNLHKFLSRQYGKQIFERIDYIKIDTEGFDASILRSMEDMMPLLKDSVLIQIEWFDYFDTSRHGGDAGPQDISQGSSELFSSISDLGLSSFYDFNCSIPTRGPQNINHSPDLYLMKKGPLITN